MSERQGEERTTAPDGRPDSVQPAWRREFPIDAPRDQYVTRRDFTWFLGLTSLAFVVGQFWILFQSWLRAREAKPAPRAVAKVEDVPAGGARAFNYPGEEDACLLLRTENGAFLAYDQRCTHLSCAVTPEVAEGRLRCPCHHGCFDLATGRPIAGPPRRPLPRVHLEVRDGVVYAVGVEERTV